MNEIIIFPNKFTLENKSSYKTKYGARKGHKAINWKNEYLIIFGGEDETFSSADMLIWNLKNIEKDLSINYQPKESSITARSYHSFEFANNQVKKFLIKFPLYSFLKDSCIWRTFKRQEDFV